MIRGMLLSFSIIAALAVALVVIKRDEIDVDGDGVELQEVASYVGISSVPQSAITRSIREPGGNKKTLTDPSDSFQELDKRIEQHRSVISGVVSRSYSSAFAEMGLTDEQAAELSEHLTERKLAQSKILLAARQGEISDEQVLARQRELFGSLDRRLAELIEEDQKQDLIEFEQTMDMRTAREQHQAAAEAAGLDDQATNVFLNTLAERTKYMMDSRYGFAVIMHSGDVFTRENIGERRAAVMELANDNTSGLVSAHGQSFSAALTSLEERRDELDDQEYQKIKAMIERQRDETSAIIKAAL